jgi:hypothetical protein
MPPGIGTVDALQILREASATDPELAKWFADNPSPKIAGVVAALTLGAGKDSTRLESEDEQWRTVVSHPHPQRRGCYVWRSGEVCTIPELLADAECGHVEPLLPPPRGSARESARRIITAMSRANGAGCRSAAHCRRAGRRGRAPRSPGSLRDRERQSIAAAGPAPDSESNHFAPA